MSTPGPGATGTLAATPVAELLIYALDKKLNGSLVLEGNDGNKSALSLKAGVVTKSRLGFAKHRLGEVCVQLAFVANDALERALLRADGWIGQRLMEEGLSEAELDHALRNQLLLQVQALAALPADTVYGYYPDRDFLEQWGGPTRPVDPLAVIWRAARTVHNPRVGVVATGLQKLPSLRLHRHSRIGRFEFSAREAALLDLLRAKPQSYDELLKSGLLEAEALGRVLHILALTRHLEVGTGFPLGVEILEQREARSISPASQPVAAGSGIPPANDLSAALSERREEILALQQKLEGANYYELLGVEAGVDSNGIQAAFFQLARKLHPDKLPAELSQYRDVVTRVFARLTEAHKTLSNPAQRAEYDRLSNEGGDTDEDQAKVQQALRAASAFQKAEVLAKRQDWAGVEKLAGQAHSDDPEQSEYGALYAYAVARSGQRGPRGDYNDLLTILNQAVQREPKNTRVKLYRAQVLQQAGRGAEAMKDFRAVAEAEPSNVEAQRELRLFKMRRGENTEEPKAEQGGLLGKFFGKS